LIVAIDASDFQQMLLAVAEQMPPPKDVAPENDLHPEPRYLRHRIDMLEIRLENVERELQRISRSE
jgi:hypothetical protein